MTSGDKSIVRTFLFLAEAYVGNGFRGSLDEVFSDDAVSLPLAYTVDEGEPLDSSAGEPLDGVVAKPLVLVIGAALLPEEMALLTRVLASAGLALGGNCLFIEDSGRGGSAALEDEIRWHMPKAVLALGDFPVPGERIPVVATCRPAELLQNEALKRAAFGHMKQLMLILARADSGYARDNSALLQKYADADRAFGAALSDAVFSEFRS